MIITACILTALAFALLGAHFMRGGEYGLMAVAVSAPFLLFIRKRWIIYVLSGLLLIGTLVWIATAIELYNIRVALQASAGRMLMILFGVGAINIIAILLLTRNKFLIKYPDPGNSTALTWSFIIAAFIMTMAHLKVNFPILLIERFVPSGGWFEIFALSLYAAWITGKMLDPSSSAIWRRRIWMTFSIVFFAQLILGLSGFETFLMTGKLHLPVPAMILAGPIYRWHISIMIFLFLGSIILLGPAWCSHLCYIGAWDDAASRSRKKPKMLPKWRQFLRGGILLLVVITALILRIFGVPSFTAGMIGLGFGVVGVGVMIFWSRKIGVMTHCITYCPIGMITVWLGKISPFRIRIDDRCTDCGICRPACRYDALNLVDIRKRSPNINCTLCGDCLGKCDDGFIEYKFAGLKGFKARTVFIVLAVAVHAAFLGLGRI